MQEPRRPPGADLAHAVERVLLVEQPDENLLFRWFVGLTVDEPVWDDSTFSRNRELLLHGDVAGKFFDAVIEQARASGRASDGHFSVDGTLADVWASYKSIRHRDGGDDDNPGRTGRNTGRNFHGERRINDTRASTTAPEARMCRKSFAIRPDCASWGMR